MDPQRFIVGSPECSIAAIIDAMKTSGTSQHFLHNWRTLAFSMETTPETVTVLGEDIKQNHITIYETMKVLLQQWTERKSVNATLGIFISILREHQLDEFAETITKRLSNKASTGTEIELHDYIPYRDNHRFAEHIPTATLISDDGERSPFVNHSRKYYGKVFPRKSQSKSCVYLVLALVCSSNLCLFTTGMYFGTRSYITYGGLGNEIQHPPPTFIPTWDVGGNTDLSSKWIATTDTAPSRKAGCNRIETVILADKEKMTYPTKRNGPCVTYLFIGPKDWEPYINIIKNSQITELTISGRLELDIIVRVLSAATPVQKIWIINDRNSDLCNSNNPINDFNLPDSRKIMFTRLTGLGFENFKSCSYVFSLLARLFTMPFLKTIDIRSSMLTKSNLNDFQELLKSVRFSLEEMYFSNTELQSQIFNNFPYVLSKVTAFQYDSVHNSMVSANFLGNDFNKYLPNLKTFICKEVPLQWEYLHLLLGMKNLEYLEFGVHIPSKETLSLVLIRESLPKLKSMAVSLLFESRESCSVIGKEALLGIKSTISGNCVIKYKPNNSMSKNN